MSAERRRYWRPGVSLDLNPSKIVRHSAFAAVVAGLLMGCIMVLLQIGIDRGLADAHRTLLYSDIFMGLVAALVTGFGLRHYQTHMANDRARMRMIAEMNHHVRNALAAISLSVYAKHDPELESITRDAIQRIDWALREVLVNTEEMPDRIAPQSVDVKTASRRSA